MLRLHSMRLFNRERSCVWQWSGTVDALAACPRQQLEIVSHTALGRDGVLAVAAGPDPFLIVPVPAELLGQLYEVATLEVEISAPPLEEWLAETAASVNGFIRELNQRDRMIQERDRELKSAEGQIINLETRIMDLQTRIVDLETSLSWRLTRPLRSAGAYVLRLAGRGR
jgi:hypothetical protein